MIGENDYTRFYQTSVTESLTNWAIKHDTFGIQLDGYKVLLAELKASGAREFILVDDNNGIIKSNTTMEGMAVSIDMIKILKRDGV